MITEWEKLVDALRSELQEYGELLNLFDQQQGAILRRAPDEVLLVNEKVEGQVKVISRCRNQRETIVTECAMQEGRSGDITLGDLLPLFSLPVQPLIEALVNEVNNLVGRTGRRARQNQLLLSRSIEISQQILRRLSPAAVTTTYSPTGQVTMMSSDPSPQYLARS